MKKLYSILALGLMLNAPLWSREGRCEKIIPPPETPDCKGRDACIMQNGKKGFCRQVYNYVGSKCFVCEP